MLTVDYDHLGLQAGETVLDLGAGFGRHAFECLRRGATVVACDLAFDELRAVLGTAQAMYEAGEVSADTPISVAQGDATRLPFPDDTFDRIIASEVMEHIPDDVAALAELTRVLKPGGVIAITVPAYLPEKICWALSDEYYAPKSPGGHVRIYRTAEMTDRLTAAGLSPTHRHRAHALHSPYWWLRCAVGPHDDVEAHFATRAYHKLLVWDISKAPALTRTAERILDPVLGKSIVHYARKLPPPAARLAAPATTATESFHAPA